MEPSSPSSLSAQQLITAVILLLLVIVTAGRIHPEAASVKVWFPCNGHLSGNFKGLCFGLINDKGCKRTCLAENSENVAGECSMFQCWCITRCRSETVAAATAPIPA